jgi:hypothetical protein
MFGCCLLSGGSAQTSFRKNVRLDSTKTPGFYQVNLSPAVCAALQQDMRDIRIIDATGKQVPYILRSDLPIFKDSKFTGLPVISVRKETDRQTHIVIENTLRQPLHELLLIIKNTDADRSVTLSGSDDNKSWFVIKEQIYLARSFSGTTDRSVQSLDFPASNYHYFKIIINGKDVLPVNIVKAGIYEESLRAGKYLPLPGTFILQKDSSDKYSYVYIRFNDFYFIDRLVIQVKSPRFYKRNAGIYTGNGTLLGSFVISSEKEPVFPVDVKTNEILLKIRNNDNPPLQINNAAGYQLNKYLITYLEKPGVYRLLFSDSTATVPEYDLETFKDSIAANITLLRYGSIEKNILPAKKIVPRETDSRKLIWMAIGIAIVMLLLLTYKLTNEIKNKPPH